MANYTNRKRDEEEERKRREAEQQAAQAQSQTAQQPEAQVKTPEPAKMATQAPAVGAPSPRGIPKLNRQQRFEVKQNVADQKTSTQIVQAGELDMLPEKLEPQRQRLEELNKEGKLGSAQTKQWSSAGNEIGVDVGSIKDVHQLAYFGTTLVSDKDREAVYKKYAKDHNLELDDVYYQAEQITGGKAFDSPRSNKGKLAAAGLYNFDGTELDPNTMTSAESLRALRMVPDSNPYKAAAKKAHISLYGWVPDEEFAFMDSADLTESDFNKQAKAFGVAFTPSDGATEANNTAYLEMLDEIEYGYGDRSPWVAKQLKAELDRAYADRTGVYPPDENELRRMADEAAGTATPEAEGEEKGFFARAAAWMGDLFGGTEKAPKTEEPQEQEDEEAPEAGAVVRPGYYASTGVASGGSGAPASSYAAAGSAPEIQGPQYQPQTAQEEPEEPAEVQGPVYQPQAQEEAPQESAEPRYVNAIAYDPDMTDAEALAYQKRGATLDPRNAAQIAWFVGNRNAMSIVSGYAPGFNTPSVMNNTEAKMHEAFSVYGQYGSEIGNAILSINNGSLPEEAQNIATLELGSVIDEIDRIVADPRNNITVPGKQNMYTYVLSLPEYEGLAARVNAVKNVQSQVNAAYAEQAQKEAEAKRALVDSAKARVTAGTATADDIALIAEATTASDYIDLYQDEMYAVFNAQMNPMKVNYFGDDKPFWQNGSAAAQEGMNIKKAGASEAGAYSTYKDTLVREVHAVLDDYTETAITLGMTLEEYLGAAGIDSLDQIADIAYNNMQSKGNAYRSDAEAQEAAEAIATSDVNSAQALLMGAESGAKSYGADFTQTAYMALDAATYNLQRMDIQNKYIGDYGYEQAAAMYYNDLMVHANSGAMDEASKADLLDHIARATNIFDVAYEIEPTDVVTDFLRTTSYELSKDVDALQEIAQTLSPAQKAIFNLTSSGVNSLIGMGVSTVVGGVTGSTIVGSAVAYGTGEWANAYDENRAKGMSPGMAGRMALGNAGLTTAVNTGGVGSKTQLFFGDDAYSTFLKAAMGDGGMGMMKAAGKEILSQAHEEGMEEVVETVVGKAYDLLDAEALAIDSGAGFSLSRALNSMTSSLEEGDPAALFREVVASYGMGAAMGGLFSVVGVTKTAIQASRGSKAQKKYQSLELANQLVEGKIPFTEENAGKAIASLQKDLEDPEYRRWIDSGAKAARDQRATMTAILSGAGADERALAVKEAQLATEYETKAAAATQAAENATNRWIELRQQVANGDVGKAASLESARMLMGKANQAKHEATTAAQKARENSRLHMEKWLHEALKQSGVYKSQAMQMRANQITEARMQLAQRLAAQYEAEEAARLEAEAVSDAAAEEEIAYAENQVFSEEEWTDEAEAAEVDAMTDGELDAEIDSIIQQESEAQGQVAEIENQREALGLTDEDVQEMTGEVTAVSAERKNRIIAREKARFNNAFERMQTALENDDGDAADQIAAEYDRIGERLSALGVNTDALIAEQYGYDVNDVNEAAEAAQTQETQRAETEKHERLTETLERQMAETAMKREQNAPARQYLMTRPIYVNGSQAADILAAEGLKSIAQVNRRYHMKLTTDESANAMPLDGHVMNDINTEAAGSVDESADPVGELLRVMQTGKELAAEQKRQQTKAKELQQKRRETEENRKKRVKEVARPAGTVDAVVSAQSQNTEAANDAQVDAAQASPVPNQRQRQAQRSKKLEGSALKSIQNLAKEMKVGLRVKSGQRFQSADYRPGKNVLGYYKNGRRNAIVRSAEAGRVSVTGHEIGHAVQEQIGLASNQQMIASWQNTFGNTGAYTPQQYDHEAFAEFFWRYLTDRDAAVSYAGDAYVDTFEQALRQKKLSKSVSKAQAQVSAYMASETDAKVRSRMVDAYKSKDADDTAFARRVEIRLADDTAAAEDFQDVIRARKDEKHLSLEDNLRDTIRFNRRASARANECLTKNLVDQNGDVVGESLREAISDVKGKDFDLFWEYELAKHSLDRDTQKGQKNQVFDEDTLSTAERKAFVDKMDAEHPEFKQANERFQKWRRLFMDTYLVNNGFLGANGSALMDALDAAYPNYVPTYRAKSGRGKAAAVGGRKYQMRTATGSTEDVINPFDSFVSMVGSIVQMTADNDSRKKFADLYDRYGAPMPGETGPGVGLFANEITQDMKKVSVSTESMREKITKMLDDIGTDPDVIMQIGDIIGDERVEYQGTGRVNMNNVITVRNEDGSKRYFEVYNPELFELLAATNTPNQAGVLDWIAKGTRMMSMLTTGSNPVFGMTNMMRDFQNSVNYGSWASNYVDGAVKWIGALWDVFRNGEASQEYDSLGGGGWTAFDTKTKKGADRVRSEVVRGYNTSNVGRIGKMVGRTIWRVATMEDLNAAIEKASRLAEYKYGKHDLTTTEGRIEAFLASQDVTTDFARKGNGQIARDLKNIVPFFNASLQGVYRTGRQLTGQESDRAGIRFAKTLINTTLASALANGIMMAYLDDDEKEEFFYLSDDLKAKHMFLPNFAPEVFGDAALIRIPLNQDPVMYAINAAVTDFAWSGESDNEYVIEMAAVADVILDNLNPVGSTILDPAISVLSNKNWYGSNIVPSYLQSYETTNQYTEETPLPFVELSKMLSGAGIKISPMMLQYVAEQYTGYIGQTLIPALPSEKNKGNVLEGWLNALVSTARKRVTSDPLTSNDVVSTVYDNYNALNAVYKAGSSKRKFDIDYLNPALSERERRRAITEADDLLHSGGEIYEAKKEISAGYDKIDQINERDDLTDEEKHVLTQSIRKQMVETALDVQEIVEDYNVRYKYNGVIPRWITKKFIGEE